MQVDNVILVEGGIIIAFGVVYSIQNSKPLTPVFVGGIGVMLIAGILDLFGEVPSAIGKALLSLAVFAVVIAEGGNLLSGIQTALKHNTATTSGK